MIELAYADDPPPDHLARMAAAFEAADATSAEAAAEQDTREVRTAPVAPRPTRSRSRRWQPVALVSLALAAVVLLALWHRRPVVTPGPLNPPDFNGTAVPPHTQHAPVSLGAGSVLRGSPMDLAVVTSQLRGRLGDLVACGPGATGTTPSPAGPLIVRFTLDATGHVSDVSVEGSGTAPKLGACVEGAIRGMRFRPPSEGSAAFSFPMAFGQGR